MEYTCCNLPDQKCEVCPKRPPNWEHLWDAPDKTFLGRCDKCHFTHLFIGGFDAQYKYCPQCGDRK